MRSAIAEGKSQVHAWLLAEDKARFNELTAAGMELKFVSGKSRLNRLHGLEYVLCVCVSVRACVRESVCGCVWAWEFARACMCVRIQRTLVILVALFCC